MKEWKIKDKVNKVKDKVNKEITAIQYQIKNTAL